MDIALSILSLFGFVALTVGTGFFVAIEFALTGLERSTIDNHVENKGDATARAIQKAHNKLSFELSGAQLGITITTLATGYLAEPILARYFTPALELVGLSDNAAPAVSLVLAMIVATLLSMVYGELVPKNMAITNPLTTARVTVGPVRLFNRVFAGVIHSLNKTANTLVRRMGIEPADELASARSPQELGALVRNSAKHGGLEESQAKMLDRSLKFGETNAEELMTPRSTIAALDADDTVTDLLALALETGHSRFPVTDGDLDATIGVVHVKDAFSIPREQHNATKLRLLARPVPTVPISLDGDAVLNAVRSAGSQVVLVADEYGGTAGIVTIEDVVEEILGEVYDEHDDTGDKDFAQLGDSWQVSGLVRVDDLPENTGYFSPEGPYETIGGLVMDTLGRIPMEGDVVLLPQTDRDFLDEFESGIRGRWIARVVAMDDRRVDKVILTPISDEEAEEYKR
ncbi:hemolysin family protein [Corynebacterium durum]|jgi:CBS domain protein|uniref:hemolysin family protein n=1 Tax=Corynebacterium durum TaxID=61592 RepID=UPI0015C6F97C|nr:hemolysin family protein [Corynebacterium durum]NYI73409.1 CBS domain containing-hemolysin-like protein [Corynebacterium durum]WJY85133.1 Magnesium and cobalt efflux protein CorC [Corynebacterium durum]